MKNNSFESQITMKKTLPKTESEYSNSAYSINSDLLNNHYDNKSIALSYEILINHFLKNKNIIDENFSFKLEQENIYKIFEEITKNIIKYNNSERQDFIIKELLNYDKTQKQFNINSSSYLMSKIAYLICLTFMKFLNNKKIRNFFDFLNLFNFISEENYKQIQMKIYGNNSIIKNSKKTLKIFEIIQNTFSFIQKIKISLPFNSITNIDFNNYLFFLYNYKWIFCDVKEIEIDLTCLFIFSNNGKNYEREDEFYKLLLAIFYLLNKIHDYEINSLKIIIPFTFSKELNHFLSKTLKEIKKELIKEKSNKEKITLLNQRSQNKIQIIEIFEHNFKHLINFSIEFNSIDIQSFICINNFICKNPQIQYLTLIFFPITSENNSFLYLNNIQLKKICEMNDLIEKNFKIINEESEYLNNNNIFYLDLLNSYFEKNLKYLTDLFQNNLNNLSYLMIDFSFPEIILNRENYCLKIIVFIMNIFYLINSNLIKVNNLELNYENLILDPNKYLYINEQLVTFEFGKNKILKCLNLNMKIANFENLFYLIPQNLVSLTLGKLCYKTAKSFINDIKFFNKLNFLSFSIKSLVESRENNYQLLKDFINNNNLPTSLAEINLNCKMNIEYEKIKNLINEDLIKNKFVQYWVFNFEFNNMNLVNKNFCQKELNTLIKNNEKQLNYISTIKYNLKLSIIIIFYKKTNLFKYNNENNSIDDPLSYKINSIDFAKIFKLIYMFLGKTKSKLVKIKLN